MKYIGVFDSDNTQKRIQHMSSKNKMLYISKTLRELGEDVEIISPSWTKNKKYYTGIKRTIASNTTLTMGPTLSYIKVISQLWSLIWLTYYLLKNVRRKETILVYHSLILMIPILIIKKLKKINIILEVEEIYSSVILRHKWLNKLEKVYIKSMNNRILVSERLKKDIGQPKDIVLYGSYETKYDIDAIRNEYSLVYAGTIDTLKGGVFTAIKMMEYIKNDKIILNVLGTGTQNDISLMQKEINRINKIKDREAIKFYGKKEGEEFEKLMNSFNCALNLQKTGNYMDSAFPSKIITYLSYNHIIISSMIESIYDSPFKKHILFSQINDLEKLADFISESLESTKIYGNESILDKYHLDFKEKLLLLLNEK